MAAPTVIDELITILTLDAEPYQRVERRVEQETDRTYRKQQQRARGTDRTARDQQRRLKDVASGVKTFAIEAAKAVGIVTGIGAAVVGVVGGFLNFETSLRRQTVGTALSNRELQAWGATARRLGADASAGAEAIAALAKERQQFNLGVPAPTLAALSKFGINVNPDQSTADIIASAQRAYRNAPEGQRQQFENVLSAQGVSADLILMIKSELDAREVYAKSLTQATEENREAADALADAFETVKATGIKVSGTLLNVLQPAIEVGAAKLETMAAEFADFVEDLNAAGGSVEDFQKQLDEHYPKLGHLFEGFVMLGDVLENLGTVATDQLGRFVQSLEDLGSWVMFFLNKSRAPWGNNRLGDDLRDRFRRVTNTNDDVSLTARAVLSFGDWWDRRVAAAKGRAGEPANTTAQGLPRNIENDPPSGLPRNIENDIATPRGQVSKPTVVTQEALMTELTARYRLTVPQAAAVVANWTRESSLRADAMNREGGGTGARGLAQWRGERTRTFQERYGVMPDQASWQQQVEFALTDPYERRLLDRSFREGGDAQSLGVAVSKYYEAHGNQVEDARRGRTAEQLAMRYEGGSEQRSNESTSTVNIQNLTVQSNDPRDFVRGLERIDTTQPYNTVIR